MLPVPYFHITVTVPAELRAVLRAHQRAGYGVLMQASAEAIIGLARDPRYVGGTVAVLAVLHTWTQQLNFHPRLRGRAEHFEHTDFGRGPGYFCARSAASPLRGYV